MWSMCSLLRKPCHVCIGEEGCTANTLQIPPPQLPPSIATYLAVVPRISFSLLPLAPHHLAFPWPLPLPPSPFTHWMLFLLFYSNAKLQPSLLPSPASHQHPILCCLKAQALSWQGQGSAQKTQEGLLGEKVVKNKWFSIIWREREKGNWQCLPICNLCPGLKQAQFWRHTPVYGYGGRNRKASPAKFNQAISDSELASHPELLLSEWR